MKELAKASESDKPISSDKKQVHQENEVLFFEAIISYESIRFLTAHSQKVRTLYSNLYSYLNTIAVFHPPTFNS
jgi:hypothetical protein